MEVGEVMNGERKKHRKKEKRKKKKRSGCKSSQKAHSHRLPMAEDCCSFSLDLLVVVVVAAAPRAA